MLVCKQESTRYRSLYQTTLNELNSLRDAMTYRQSHPLPESKSKPSQQRPPKKSDEVIAKQLQQVETLVAENKAANQLIQRLYNREAALLKEIKFLSRALQLKKDANGPT